MNNRFEGRGNGRNDNGRYQNEDSNVNGKQRGGQQHRGGQPIERQDFDRGHQSQRPDGGDSNYGYANQSRSFSSDSRDQGYDMRELGYGDRDNQYADRGSMQSNNEPRGQGMNQGFRNDERPRYQGANRGSYNGALDDSLWGPSHYPHPTSSGTTWSGGSYGGGSSFGIGIGSGSGNDMGVPFRGATTENQYGGHDYGRGHEAHPQQPKYARGPKGYKRSDERLKEDLSEKLHHAYEIDSSDVEIEVSNGEITLTGTVPSREMRYRLEHLADGVVGVNDINNNVKVKREMSGTTPNAYSSDGGPNTKR